MSDPSVERRFGRHRRIAPFEPDEAGSIDALRLKSRAEGR